MKLRIKGDSVRLRLTQGEVRALAEEGSVTECVNFGPSSKLEYRVTRDAAVSTMTAGFASNLIEIRIPERQAIEWCRSETVTLEHSSHTPAGELKLVVEKDFSCLVPRSGEDETDHFPHPLAPVAR